jgi:ketosteroid isomerase-like protein
MEERVVERLHEAYAAFNDGDLDPMLALCSPQVEFVVGTGTYRGVAQVRGWLEDLLGGLERVHIEIEDVIDAGDRVVVLLRGSAHGERSGIDIDQRPAHVVEFRDGVIVRSTSYADRRRALAAAGLS